MPSAARPERLPECAEFATNRESEGHMAPDSSSNQSIVAKSVSGIALHERSQQKAILRNADRLQQLGIHGIYEIRSKKLQRRFLVSPPNYGHVTKTLSNILVSLVYLG